MLTMAELSDRELLVQIGTRLEGLKEVVSETRQSVSDLDRKIDSMEHQMKLEFITKNEFEPIRKLVYGLVSLVLTAVVLALIAQVVINP
jgi:hypothetical protein